MRVRCRKVAKSGELFIKLFIQNVKLAAWVMMGGGAAGNIPRLHFRLTSDKTKGRCSHRTPRLRSVDVLTVSNIENPASHTVMEAAALIGRLINETSGL